MRLRDVGARRAMSPPVEMSERSEGKKAFFKKTKIFMEFLTQTLDLFRTA
jgi:hypothetical protein